MCKKLDYRTQNNKLWNFAKRIDELKPSNEDTNAIIDDNGHVSVDGREEVDALAKHYAKGSSWNVNRSEKLLARIATNQLKYCLYDELSIGYSSNISPSLNYCMPSRIWTLLNPLAQTVSMVNFHPI
ncbi:RNase H domain-containing protein [Caerostris darwini]|uniref:RNase H domain-containing protein n=1 Tax=Caerostris darwini TaxID=1538125 RepID=A0AAV4UCL9_9ARAC|nr:RNase H domain-containing protein [Caerostris darwini]